MPEKDETTPATPSLAYTLMLPKWQKANSLLGGTDSMRGAGRKYMPQHEHEDRVTYAERLAGATLHNAYKLTLNSLVGRPFSDPIVLSDDMPEQVVDLLEDVDLKGNTLSVFAREVFREGVCKGIAHVMVDMPRRPDNVATLADERKELLRPYWVFIRPENMLAAAADTVNGREVLTHVRIAENEVVPSGKWGEKVVERVRVWELLDDFSMQALAEQRGAPLPGRVVVTLYQRDETIKQKEDQWVQVEQYLMEFDEIPMVTFYTDRKDFMLSDSPLDDLADLNIRHWRSTSDQNNVLTVARFPILAASGVPDEEADEVSVDSALESKDALALGPKRVLSTERPEAKYYYVEHTGAAIEAGRNDLRDTEERMAEYGADILRKRTGGVTATARALDSAEATSPLQDMTIRFTAMLNSALRLTAKWLNMEPAGTVSVSTDFGPEEISGVDLNTLVAMRKNRDISRTQFIIELKRRAVLADDFDIDANDAEIEAEMAMFAPPETDIDPAQDEEEEEDEREEST